MLLPRRPVFLIGIFFISIGCLITFMSTCRTAAPSRPTLTSRERAKFEAASSSSSGTLKKLVRNRLQANIKDEYGISLLMVAALNGREKSVQFLLGLGADPNAVSDSRNTALMYAAQRGHRGVIRRLISARANIKAKNSYGGSAMGSAVLNNHPTTVHLLLNLGSVGDDIDRRTGRNLVLSACARGYTKIVRILLNRGFSSNVKDKHGMTPLMLAAENGDWNLIRILLAAGSDRSATDRIGRSAYDIAKEKDATRVLELLGKKKL